MSSISVLELAGNNTVHSAVQLNIDSLTETVTPFHHLKRVMESKPRDFMITTCYEFCFDIGKQFGSYELMIYSHQQLRNSLTYVREFLYTPREILSYSTVQCIP